MRKTEQLVRVGSFGSVALVLLRTLLTAPTADAAKNNWEKFRQELLPSQNRAQLLTDLERTNLIGGSRGFESPRRQGETPLSLEYLREVAAQFGEELIITNVDASQLQLLARLSGIVETDLQSARVATLQGRRIFLVGSQFYGLNLDDSLILLTTEADLDVFLTTSEVAANWLSAPAGERATVETAPALLEVMNNPDAEIPPVQVTSWSVMDFSQMPDEYVEYYSNYPIEEAVGTDVPELDNTSFEWMVVPDARVDQFLNVTFPEFIQNLPADGEVNYVTPEGEVVTTTTGAMRELAPQIITEVVGEEKLKEIPDSVWNIGESSSTAVMYNAETNVATVYVSFPDTFDPFTGTMSRIYYSGQLSVFSSDVQTLMSDPIFSGHFVTAENDPNLSIDVITSPLELEVGRVVLGVEFQFQPVGEAE